MKQKLISLLMGITLGSAVMAATLTPIPPGASPAKIRGVVNDNFAGISNLVADVTSDGIVIDDTEILVEGGSFIINLDDGTVQTADGDANLNDIVQISSNVAKLSTMLLVRTNVLGSTVEVAASSNSGAFFGQRILFSVSNAFLTFTNQVAGTNGWVREL